MYIHLGFQRALHGGADLGAVVLYFGLIVLTAISGIVAAAGLYYHMYLLAMMTYLPVGGYLLLTPGRFRLVGVLGLLYVSSAVALHVADRRIPPVGRESIQR